MDDITSNDKYWDISAVILAAGYSSRMGDFKPLLPIGERTAIEHEVKTLQEVGIEQITAVIGYKKELLHQLLIDLRVRAAYNEQFSEGMFTSIQQGIKAALDTHISGFLLMLVDCPLIPAEVIEKIIEEHRKDPAALIVPCYRGKKGHPLFIPTIYAKEIMDYKGSDGLKAITNRHEDRLIRLEVKDEAVVLDMDTQEGYDEILEYYHGHKKADGQPAADVSEYGSITESYLKLAKENGVRRLFLIRHGQIEQHDEKIFLGQTDTPLSELGKRQARNAGKKLFSLGFCADRLYTSDLQRAKASAERIVNVLEEKAKERGEEQAIQVIEEREFREMNLGTWDGKKISEIKAAYSAEYEKRGQDLLAYKYGHDSENFYDLQYRVMKAFKKLLKNYTREDLVIVAHDGVIKVILANLHDITLAEAVKQKIPAGQIIKVDFMQM